MLSKTMFFDFDGTIACTEPYHKTARNMVLRSFGVTVDNWLPYLGDSDLMIFNRFKEKYHLVMDVQATIDLKLFIFQQSAVENDLKPFEDIEKMIRLLPYNKMIVSRQREEIIRFFLKRWNLDSCFSAIYSLAESDKTKADVIKELRYPLNQCVLLDDIQDIVDETRNAGIYSILIKNGKMSAEDKDYLYYGFAQ